MGIIRYAGEAHVGAAAERFLVLLFQCYTTAVLTYMALATIVNVEEATKEAESRDAVEAADNATRWVGDKITAAIMQQIADRSFEASGWPGGSA